MGKVFLHPSGEFWGGFGVGFGEGFETGLGGGEVGAVEEGADVLGDAGAHVEAWDEGLGVLLKVDLAALPGDGGENGGACGGKAGVGVADDELEAVEATGLKGGQEVAPVDFGFAEGDTDTEDGAFAFGG